MISFRWPVRGLVFLPGRILQIGVETVYGYFSTLLLRFTIFRFVALLLLLPFYVLKLLFSFWGDIQNNYLLLFSAKGREELADRADIFREDESWLAQQQLEGTYLFEEDQLARVKRNGLGWMSGLNWMNENNSDEYVGEFTVCNATVRYSTIKESKLRPDEKKYPPKSALVFLHGSPGWSYMWRNILLKFAKLGHRVYTLDWIGHGRSDKVLEKESLTLELHMRTLMTFVTHVRLKSGIFIAHDWGGCIALCTIPYLPAATCSGLVLINSFPPPRPSEINLHYHLLYAIWYLSTGILSCHLPGFVFMKAMCPSLSHETISAYEAPYIGLPASAKSSICRFAHMAPISPHFLLRQIRCLYLWKVIEGLLGAVHFSDINAQTRLMERDEMTRRFWHRGHRNWVDEKRDQGFRALVMFGVDEPLLKGYKDILVQLIDSKYAIDWAKDGVWLEGAGHYPVEEKTKKVGELIAKFVER